MFDIEIKKDLGINPKQEDGSAQHKLRSDFSVDADLCLPNNASTLANQESKSSAESCIPRLELSRQEEFSKQEALLAEIEKPGNYSKSLRLDGTERNYHIHVPPGYDPAKPMPLVLVLHGHGDDAAGVARVSGMDAKADREGFIVVYPEAVHWLGERSMAAWDTGNGLVPPGAHASDTGFLRRVIDNCQSQLRIDENRTFLVGFSNGAMEAYKAATELSDKISAVVAVSGAMSGAERKPEFPISILSMVGTADSGVPLAGRSREEVAAYEAPEKMRMLGNLCPLLKNDMVSPWASELLQLLALELGFVPVFKPVTYATDFWKSVNDISGSGTKTKNGGISIESYTNPQNGVTVAQEIISGGDHMIQHGAPAGFDLAEEIWSFLKAHPRNGAAV